VQFLWRLFHVVSSKEESGGEFEKPCEQFEALKDHGRSSSESQVLSTSQWATRKASEISLNYGVESVKSSHMVFQCIEKR
jgi:hypothetical protein